MGAKGVSAPDTSGRPPRSAVGDQPALALAPDHPQQLSPVGGRRRDQLAGLGEPVPQLPVTDLDREHRILHLGHHLVSPLDRRDCPFQMDPGVRGVRAGRSRGEAPGGQPVPLCKLGVGTTRPSVRSLDRPEQLLLEAIGLLVV